MSSAGGEARICDIIGARAVADYGQMLADVKPAVDAVVAFIRAQAGVVEGVRVDGTRTRYTIDIKPKLDEVADAMRLGEHQRLFTGTTHRDPGDLFYGLCAELDKHHGVHERFNIDIDTSRLLYDGTVRITATRNE